MKIDFWSNFEILYLREYFIEFHKTASPNILGVEGPHHVAKNFSNTFCHKFRQQFQKLDFISGFFAKIGIFDFSVWRGRGCAWSEMFFWRDPYWLGVKPHGRPKSRTRPPLGVTNLFSSPSMDFGWNFIIKHENWFLIQLWDSLSSRIFYRIS